MNLFLLFDPNVFNILSLQITMFTTTVISSYVAIEAHPEQ